MEYITDTECDFGAEDTLGPPQDVLALYREAFHAFGRCEKALLWGKNKQHVRFAALCRSIPNAAATLLDYGCGLGDLATWLRVHRPMVAYTGADALAEFVASNQAALPDLPFFTSATPHGVAGSFDHVVCSGVFNLDPADNHERHWRYVRGTLEALFAKTRVALHVDFLAHDVDFRQPHAHHQDTAELMRFVEGRLSRRYVLDRSYMPYEFSISIFSDRGITHGRNIYAKNHYAVGN
jgi:hypothetical protein